MRAVSLKLAVFLAMVPVLAGHAQADVVLKSEAGFVVGAEVDMPSQSPTAVWAALIVPAGWWNPVHSWSGDAANMSIDPEAGGCFCEKVPLPKDAPNDMRPGSVEHMRVIAAMPPKLLRMTGALGPLQGEALTGTMTVVLKPRVGGGTHVTWSYVVGGFMRQKRDEIAPVVDEVLTEQFNRLAKSVAHIPVEPPPVSDKDAR